MIGKNKLYSLICYFLTDKKLDTKDCVSFMTSSQRDALLTSSDEYYSESEHFDYFKSQVLTTDQTDVFSKLVNASPPCNALFGDELVLNLQCYDRGDLHFLVNDELLYTNHSSIDPSDPVLFEFEIRKKITYVFCDTEECTMDSFEFCKKSDTFTIIGDDHFFSKLWDAETYVPIVSQIEQKCPSFHVSMGDLFVFSKECSDDMTFECCDEYAKTAREYFPKGVPFYSLIGNWEDTTLTELDSKITLDVLSRRLVKPRVDKCGNDLCTYYTFVKGDTRLIVLDSETYSDYQNSNKWDQTLGYDQYRWLSKVLNSSAQTFHAIFLHRLLGRSGASFHYYEWGGIDRDLHKNADLAFGVHRPNFTSPVHDLISKSSNPIVFIGHDHVYNREIRDNVVYLSVPQASNPYPHRRELFPCTSFYHINPGHLEVTLASDSLSVEYIYFNESLIDAFSIFSNGSISFEDPYDCMN